MPSGRGMGSHTRAQICEITSHPDQRGKMVLEFINQIKGLEYHIDTIYNSFTINDLQYHIQEPYLQSVF